LIAENAEAPVSLGVLPADAVARIALTEQLKAALQNGTLAVSDEPIGGSTTGAPTGDVLAVGKVITS
jgi:anti-sigma-K factor RskA